MHGYNIFRQDTFTRRWAAFPMLMELLRELEKRQKINIGLIIPKIQINFIHKENK